MVEPGIKCAAAIFFLAPTGYGHELGSATPGARPNPGCDLIAIHIGESDIQKQRVRLKYLG
jgi:hypothetical protein